MSIYFYNVWQLPDGSIVGGCPLRTERRFLDGSTLSREAAGARKIAIMHVRPKPEWEVVGGRLERCKTLVN